jgi:hypothetical protein
MSSAIATSSLDGSPDWMEDRLPLRKQVHFEESSSAAAATVAATEQSKSISDLNLGTRGGQYSQMRTKFLLQVKCNPSQYLWGE